MPDPLARSGTLEVHLDPEGAGLWVQALNDPGGFPLTEDEARWLLVCGLPAALAALRGAPPPGGGPDGGQQTLPNLRADEPPPSRTRPAQRSAT